MIKEKNKRYDIKNEKYERILYDNLIIKLSNIQNKKLYHYFVLIIENMNIKKKEYFAKK